MMTTYIVTLAHKATTFHCHFIYIYIYIYISMMDSNTMIHGCHECFSAVLSFNGAFLHLLALFCSDQRESMDITWSHIQVFYFHVAFIKAWHSCDARSACTS